MTGPSASAATGATSEILNEARRDMEICNACRYCEGYCAVFPAMELRRAFSDQDLNYLANLCHNCRGCYYACQYAPPHEFGVNLPKVFAELRVQTYAQYAWPAPLARAFERNGVLVSLIAALGVAAVLILTMLLQSSGVLYGAHAGPGAFYAIIPYPVMLVLSALTFVFALVAFAMGFANFWRDTGGGAANARSVGRALYDIFTLRNLGGGGHGCNDLDESFSGTRRWLHHAMFYGFLLCFAATCTAALYQDFLGVLPPYGWFSVPVVLGTLGGIGLLIGTIGLFRMKLVGDAAPSARRLLGMDVALLMLLAATGLTGLLLLALRTTAAMGVLLAVHFGFVLALFLVLPYSKFVHGVYRSAALLRYAVETPKPIAPSRASASSSAAP